MRKMTKFESMLNLAFDLGGLLWDKHVVEVITAYMKAWASYTDGKYQILDDRILGANYIGPGKLGEWNDMTVDVLFDIYGEDNDIDYELYEELC